MKFIIIMVLLVVAASVTVQSKSLETFMINGQDSAIIRFYAYLEIFREADFGGLTMYFGGGTLISSTLVLTVAQNVDGFKSWRIGLGANRLSDMQWFNATQATAHFLYDNRTLSNNLAVIRLTQPVPNNEYIGPVNLLSERDLFPPEGTKLEAYGFGFNATNLQPIILQTAVFTITSQQNCEVNYPHLLKTGQTSNHFCAENKLTQGNICAGDQGGPIFDKNLGLVIGIQSFIRVEDCASPEAQPAGFIRVAEYTNWIVKFFREF